MTIKYLYKKNNDFSGQGGIYCNVNTGYLISYSNEYAEPKKELAEHEEHVGTYDEKAIVAFRKGNVYYNISKETMEGLSQEQRDNVVSAANGDTQYGQPNEIYGYVKIKVPTIEKHRSDSPRHDGRLYKSDKTFFIKEEDFKAQEIASLEAQKQSYVVKGAGSWRGSNRLPLSYIPR